MTGHDWIAILDFGSQYTQLIARRIREQNVYCEILRFDSKGADLAARKPKGIILSGGPSSVFEDNAPSCDPGLFDTDIPILGICYGMQLMTQSLGGKVSPGNDREYGPATIQVVKQDSLFRDLPSDLKVWMSHGDQVEVLPDRFEALAKTSTCPVAAMADIASKRYGLQFHPEVVHTPHGKEILNHFLVLNFL